jgi:uncharacterized membrane protein
MTEKRAKIIQGTALLGCGLITAQIAIIIFRGESFCLNQGCKIIENLTLLPPLAFNLAGLFFFLSVLPASRSARKRAQPGFDWLRLLLLSGLAVEGILISYQMFVVQTACFYCLTIFALVALLNIISGRRQLLLGGPLFLAMLIAAGTLNFGPSQALLQAKNLGAGTFAVQGSATPTAQLYLFFSADCPHCRNVLDVMAEADNCEINFNPVDKVEALGGPGLTYLPDYKPAVNRLLLSLLEIKTIPVMLAKNQDDFSIVKGETAIIDYLKRTCFDTQPPPYSGSSSDDGGLGFSTDTAPTGECAIEVECPPDSTEQPTSSAY